MNNFLITPIEFLKGIGPQKAEVLKKEVAVFTFGDFLEYYPFRYVDRSVFHKVKDIYEAKANVQIKGRIISILESGKGRNKRLTAKFQDDTGIIELIWFKGIRWIKNSLDVNKDIQIFGRPSNFKGKWNIAHPEISGISSSQEIGYQPVYPSTEKLNDVGLNSKAIQKLIKLILNQLNGQIEETFSDEMLIENKLISKEKAIKLIHSPKTEIEAKRAKFRLKFEELFFLQMELLVRKKITLQKSKGYVMTEVGDEFNIFYENHLKFDLTNAQKRVLKEIRKDLNTGHHMNRLLQGDVGSGKTIVAFMSALIAIGNGFQACIMTPTEILSYQHYNKFNEICKLLNINMKVLTGSSKTKYKKELKLSLIEGDIDLLIGTHAIIYDGIVFKNLGIAIIDEQHKFGVAQRSKLWHKNNLPPHILIMTATPIPRTLAMSVYGDLDMSIINELPPGRKHINTIHQTNKDRLKLIDFVKLQISKGRQIYVVYPLIKESEKLDFKDLIDGYESFSRDFPMPDYQISIVHGKMKNEDKDYEMKRFIENKTQILVSTTVIEVGVDIPNATVMIIESAERFGLSQLHQLRGRVGRGSHNSYCFLITGDKRTKESKIRMKTMVSTNDGFIIAEKDLELRGPGNIIGTQQSGEMPLRITNLVADSQLIHKIRLLVMKILEKDPDLINVNNKIINNYLKLIINKKNIWEYIS